MKEAVVIATASFFAKKETWNTLLSYLFLLYRIDNTESFCTFARESTNTNHGNIKKHSL